MQKLLLSILILFCTLAQAQVTVPKKIIGNWINEHTNEWEVGLFEDFAVYQSGFWSYTSIQVTGNGAKLQLKQGKKSLILSLMYTNTDTGLFIAAQIQKATKFRKHRAGFTPYTTVDKKPFKNSGFKQDTVTVIGYYRNLEAFNKGAGKDQGKGPFSISLDDFIQNKQVQYFADIDSLGRFEIKFPVLNTQQVFVDYDRLSESTVVEPGESIFLYADLADYIEDFDEDDDEAYEAYSAKPKRILFMGSEARLHNEIAGYHSSTSYFDLQEAAKKFLSDIELQQAAIANYELRLKHLKSYIERFPSLSERFKQYQYASQKYSLASKLMQHRFNKWKYGTPAPFDKGYMEFIQSNMAFDDEKLFTLVGSYSTFIRDYLEYYNEIDMLSKDSATGKQKLSLLSVSNGDALKYLAGKDVLNSMEEEVIDSFIIMQKTIVSKLGDMYDSASTAKTLAPYQELIKKFAALQEKPEVKKDIKQVTLMLLSNKRLASYMHTIDSIFNNQPLKQLLIARQLFYFVEHNHIPLSDYALQLANQRLTNPFIKDYILKVDNYYRSLEGKQISYQASLKKTDHLKEAKNADLLFKELVAPYKGKVIYIDFWGTWCVPCMQQMPYAVTLKKELANKDVIFMYLANNSPENSWTNAIKKLDLTGENVVHYRLPDEQQGMIERKFLVNSFPTYMLIGKDGKLVSDKAPRPEEKPALMEAINKLLNQ